jgi:hypothetical protein
MRAILFSTLALGALTSAALADEPLTLTDVQMDSVVAAGSPGNGIDTAYSYANSHDKSDENSTVINSNGAPYSTGDIGFSDPQDTSTGNARRNSGVYSGWGTQSAPGQ